MHIAFGRDNLLPVNADPGPSTLTEQVGVLVARPVAAVWAYVSDLGNLCEWRTHLREVRWIDPAGTVGARFEGLSSFGPWRNTRLVCQLTEWEPEHHLRYKVVEGPIRADALWGVRPVGEGTYLYGAGDISGHTWTTRLLRPLAKPLFKRETRSELLLARDILESR